MADRKHRETVLAAHRGSIQIVVIDGWEPLWGGQTATWSLEPGQRLERTPGGSAGRFSSPKWVESEALQHASVTWRGRDGESRAEKRRGPRVIGTSSFFFSFPYFSSVAASSCLVAGAGCLLLDWTSAGQGAGQWARVYLRIDIGLCVRIPTLATPQDQSDPITHFPTFVTGALFSWLEVPHWASTC